VFTTVYGLFLLRKTQHFLGGIFMRVIWFSHLAAIFPFTILSQSQMYLITCGQSTSISWCQAAIWDPGSFFSPFLEIIFRHVLFCCYRAPAFTWGRFCNLQLLLGLASAIFLGSDSAGLTTKFCCLIYETPLIWRARFPYLFPHLPPRVAQL
jgi:hypothetical protein